LTVVRSDHARRRGRGAASLYHQESEKGALRPVEKAELARGRFTRGATRLEFGDRPPLRFLLVPRRELTPAIDSIAKDPLLAATLSRPRRPAYSSARGA
jgi:hypothetical protein